MYRIRYNKKCGRKQQLCIIYYAKELSRLSEASPEDKIAYSQMHLVFELIASMNEEETDEIESKTEKRNRNDVIRRQIINFIADKEISDSKTIAKAIGLKPSRTRDYLKQLVDEGILETKGEYKNRKYMRSDYNLALTQQQSLDFQDELKSMFQ